MAISFIVTIIAFTILWLISTKTKNTGLTDGYWGPGFAVIGISQLAFQPSLIVQLSAQQWLVLVLVLIWSTRLGLHLTARHFAKKEEDGRYLKMRQEGGSNFWWVSFGKIYLLQAVTLWLIAAPIHALMIPASRELITGLLWIGVTTAIAGFLIETFADHQLKTGTAASQHRTTFRSGLWQWSRHPNYFGELVFWWGIATAVYAISGNWLAFGGPALLTIVIKFISVPITEKHLLQSRTDYLAYQKETAAIVPSPR